MNRVKALRTFAGIFARLTVALFIVSVLFHFFVAVGANSNHDPDPQAGRTYFLVIGHDHTPAQIKGYVKPWMVITLLSLWIVTASCVILTVAVALAVRTFESDKNAN